MCNLCCSIKGRRVAQKLRCVFVDARTLLEEQDESKEVICGYVLS